MKETSIDFKRFLNLLCSGLYEEDLDLPLFVSGRVDWELIFRYSQKQTVCGTVFAGISRLPIELRPPKMIYLQWCSMVAKIEVNNEHMNRELSALKDLLQQQGIDFVLLKGQGAASRYPNPIHRISGDIDLYVAPDFFQRALDCFDAKGILRLPCGEEKHVEYHWNGTLVEIHHSVNRFNDPLLNKRLKHIVAEWFPEKCDSVDIAGCAIRIPPATFDVFYMLTHMYYHLLSGGVGLRQLCDWVLLLRHSKDKIDKKELANYLKSFHFARVYGAIAYIAVTYLQLPASDLPIALRKSDKAYGERVMRIVMTGGNFGKYDEEGVREVKSDLLSQLGNFWRVCKSCYRLFSFCPAESIWFPIQKVRFYLKKK